MQHAMHFYAKLKLQIECKSFISKILLVFFLQKLITCSLSIDLDFLPQLCFSHNLVRTLAELHVLIRLSTFGYFVIQQFIFKKISGENSCTSKNPDQYPDLLCDVIQRGRKHKIRSRKATNVYPPVVLVKNQISHLRWQKFLF